MYLRFLPPGNGEQLESTVIVYSGSNTKPAFYITLSIILLLKTLYYEIDLVALVCSRNCRMLRNYVGVIKHGSLILTDRLTGRPVLGVFWHWTLSSNAGK